MNKQEEKASRQWYPRYPGDYGRKTAHLSLCQHGAYALLMDWYFSNGKPLPLDWLQLHRICKAVAPSEQASVHDVVGEFFTQTADGWRNKRADEEIIKRDKVSEVRRLAQAERERQRANARAKQGAKGGAKGVHLQEQPQPQPQEDTKVSLPPTPTDAGIDANGRPTRAKVIEFPEWLMEDGEAQRKLQEFVAMRARIKRPIVTQYQFNRLLGQLTRLHNEGHDASAVIQQSVERAWEGFYELKAEGPKKSYSHRMMEATAAGVLAARQKMGGDHDGAG